jgi:hypothetical protein
MTCASCSDVNASGATAVYFLRAASIAASAASIASQDHHRDRRADSETADGPLLTAIYDLLLSCRLQDQVRDRVGLRYDGNVTRLYLDGFRAHALRRRAFSMAMTAWAAKFVTSSICFWINGRTS